MPLGKSALGFIAAIAVCFGGLIGYQFAQRPNPEVSIEPGPSVPGERETDASGVLAVVERTDEARLRELEHKLETERELREALERKVARLLALQPVNDPTPVEVAEAPSPLDETPFAQHAVDADAAAAATGSAEQAKEWFDRDALARAGLSSSEIAEIEARWEEHEMEKLYLTDQATRDGTLRTQEFFRQMLKLNRQVRNDLGVEGYDAYLYATGKPNRLNLKQVLENSPAGYAGLEAGDMVIRYDGERVFHGAEFKAATSRGEPGAPTSIEVVRDGQLLRFSVPRGPLGVQLDPVVAPPERNL